MPIRRYSMGTGEDWEKVRVRCYECSNLIIGYRNSKGDIKYKCDRCESSIYSARKFETIGNKVYKAYKINVKKLV